MAFWVRNDSGGVYTVNDLGFTIPAAEEKDLSNIFYYQDIEASADLHTAFGTGDLVKLDGQGGSPVTPGTEFDDAVNQHVLDGTGHTGLLGIDQLKSINDTVTTKAVPVNADVVLIEDSADSYSKKKATLGTLPSGGGGEANTASNQGTGGVGFYDAKVGVDLQFRNLNSTTDRVGVALNGANKDVDITLNEGNIVHQNLSGAGLNTHAQIDTHIGSTSNPHLTDVGNLGSGTLAELNSKVTDATLDDSSDPRDPNAHATTHENGGADEISVLGLSGLLADPQTPTTHAATHENGGADEVPHQNLNGAGVNTHGQIDSHIGSTSNPHSVTKTQVGLGNVTDDAQLKRAADDWSVFGEKVSPVGADYVLIEDSTAARAKKYVQVTNLPGGGGSGPGADMKASEVLAAAFAGNPKKATVAFITAYSSANYAISLSCVTSVQVQFAPSVENKTASGFTINMGANQINGLVAVTWTTAPYGEA